MFNNLVVKIRSTASFLLAVLYLVQLLVQWNWLDNFIKLLLVFVLVLSLLAVRGTSRIIGYVLFLAGGAILILYRAPLSVWVQALNRNLYLLVMFTLVPLLEIPIRRGGYMEALRGFFRRYIRRDNQFYLLLNTLTFFIAVMLNVAAVPLMYQIGQASEKSKNHRLVSTAIIRGFAASVMWSPSYAAVALIIDLTDADWVDYFPYGLFMGILALLLGWLMTVRGEREDGTVSKDAGTGMAVEWTKIAELITFGVILIAGIVFISVKTGINTVIVVAMMSLFFPLLWLAVIRRLPVLVEEFRTVYFQDNLPKVKNLVVLFLGAGFLATAINFSDLGYLIPQLFYGLIGTNAVLFTIMVMVLVALFSAAGVHPIITVTIIATTVDPATYGVTNTFMALLLASSWSVGVAVSPSSAMNIAMAGLVERSPLDVGPRWNGGYIVVLMLMIAVIVDLLLSIGVF